MQGNAFRMLAVCLLAGLLGCEPMTLSLPSQKEEIEEPPCNYEQALVDARTIIQQALISSNPWTRAHAMEAVGATGGVIDPGFLVQGVIDPAPPVQYAAAMAIGEFRYEPAKSHLEQLILNRGADERSVCAAIYALYRMGDDRFVGQLAAIIDSPEWQGRAAAAEVMGKMGHVSAIPFLKSKYELEEEPEAKQTIALAMARLGDRGAKQLLEGYASGVYVDSRLLLIPSLAELQTPHVRELLQTMRNDPVYLRVRIVTVEAMAILGIATDEDYQYVMGLALHPKEKVLETRKSVLNKASRYATDPDEAFLASVKQLAANALGRLNRKPAVGALQILMRDSSPDVQLAAARATLRLLTPTGTLDPASRGIGRAHPTSSGAVRPMHTSGAMD